MRLTDSSEFEKVYRQGVAFRCKLFSVHAFRNEMEASRLGLSVSRKVGNAVVRNAVRRKLREVFKASLPGMQTGWDLVVSARPASAGADLGVLQTEFDRGLRKLGVLVARREEG